MLILNPTAVELGSLAMGGVSSLTVDRQSVTPLEQWGAGGPWCRLVDSPKRRVSITIKLEPAAPLDAGPALGSQAELRAFFGPASGDRLRRRLRATCVVVAVTHQHPPGRAPVRTVELLAVSPSGATDPVVIEEAAS